MKKEKVDLILNRIPLISALIVAGIMLIGEEIEEVRLGYFIPHSGWALGIGVGLIGLAIYFLYKVIRREE